MKVTICRGLPGCGKSYWAENVSRTEPSVFIVSADRYPGLYEGGVFHPELLPKAHDFCLFDYDNLTLGQMSAAAHIIVDNTNLQGWEIAPYYRLAEIRKHEVKILNFVTDPETCFARQTHGVPKPIFDQMVTRFEGGLSTIPPWWKVENYTIYDR